MKSDPPTRLAVLSDIHGNLPALEAVVANIAIADIAIADMAIEGNARLAVDGIIVAGDLGRGPDDNQVIRLLRSLPSWVIRGNGESFLLRFSSGQIPDSQIPLKQYAALRWCSQTLQTDTLAYIQSLPEQRVIELPQRDAIRVVHGSPRNPNELLYPDRDPLTLDAALEHTCEPVLIFGHTHQPWQKTCAGRLALNPGSVGLPVNGVPRAQYAVLKWSGEQWTAEHHTVSYDLHEIDRRFRDSGYLEHGGAFARALLLSAVGGKDTLVGFLKHTRSTAAQAGVEDLNAIPDDVWDLADRTFDWALEESKCAGWRG